MEIYDDLIRLRTIEEADLESLWEISYHKNLKWMEYDGPYFLDPIHDKKTFVEEIGIKYYVRRATKFLIIKNNEIVGLVTASFEDGSLMKWLEFGIVIYEEEKWGKNIGFQALKLFITYLFKLYKDIRRVGFTTWSGNYGMIKLGEKLGLKKEAEIRQVRYWKDQYWDSIKYGVLREEWQDTKYMLG